MNDYAVKIDVKHFAKVEQFQNYFKQKSYNIQINIEEKDLTNVLKLKISNENFSNLGRLLQDNLSKLLEKVDSETLVLDCLTKNIQFLLIVLSNIYTNVDQFIP